MILSVEPIRSFETGSSGEPAAPRPAPRSSRQSRSGASPPSSAGRSPSGGRAPARLSVEDAVEELHGMSWLRLCGLDDAPASRSLQVEDARDSDEDGLGAAWMARCGL